MPNVSRDTASETIALEGLDVRVEHLEGGYSVCFESHTADADLAALFRGLADDRCQLSRWGYVPPPVHYAGAEIVEFSPTDVLGETIPVVLANLRS